MIVAGRSKVTSTIGERYGVLAPLPIELGVLALLKSGGRTDRSLALRIAAAAGVPAAPLF